MKTTHLILLCGKPRSGKTTVKSGFLPLVCGADTSTYIINSLAKTLNIDSKKILENKEKYRDLLKTLGDAIYAENPTELVEQAMDSTMYKTPWLCIAGVRRADELQATREKFARAGTVVTAIWCSRPKIVHLKDNTDSNLREFCDFELQRPFLKNPQFIADSQLLYAIANKTEVVSTLYTLKLINSVKP